jgi:hypothetical protein
MSDKNKLRFAAWIFFALSMFVAISARDWVMVPFAMGAALFTMSTKD